MKTIKLLLMAAVAIVTMTACGGKSEDGPTPPSQNGTVVAQWQLTAWSALPTTDAVVYAEFHKDGKFDLYQRLYTPAFVHLTGTYKYSKGHLSGTYSDGVAWLHTYNVSFANEGQSMRLTAADDATDVADYEQTVIPTEIIEGTLSESRAAITDAVVRFL